MCIPTPPTATPAPALADIIGGRVQKISRLRLRRRARDLLRVAQAGGHGGRPQQPVRVRGMLPPPQLRLQVGEEEAFLRAAQAGGHAGR